jgi:hypothetical protein
MLCRKEAWDDRQISFSENYNRAHAARLQSPTTERLYSERLKAPQLADHRPLLTEAGFTIETHEEPQGWRDQHRTLV